MKQLSELADCPSRATSKEVNGCYDIGVQEIKTLNEEKNEVLDYGKHYDELGIEPGIVPAFFSFEKLTNEEIDGLKLKHLSGDIKENSIGKE